MKQGTAIRLPVGSDARDAVQAVYDKYAEKIRSPKGWFGNATVHVVDDDDAVLVTYIVKATTAGFDVYEKTATIPVVLEARIG